MKKFLSICICFGLLCVFTGCSGSEKKTENLPYKEDEILKQAEAIIKDFNNKEYEKMLSNGTAEVKTLTKEKLESGWKETIGDIGKFKENTKHEITSNTEAVVIGVISEYEKGSVQFTFTFDKDNKLAGLWFKPV